MNTAKRREHARTTRTASQVASIFLLVISGCSEGGSRPSPTPSDGTLVVATGAGITGLNQLTGAHSRFGQDVLDLLFLSLFEEQPDFADHPPTFEPELVADYWWSEDKLELGLRLRDDVVWSDATPLTAEDVRWSLEAQRDPDIAWAYASSKDSIREIEVTGPHDLVVHFSTAYASQLADLNVGVVMPKHAWSRLPFSEWRRNGGWFVDNLVTSGPYTLATWRPQEEIVLVANPRYSGPDRPAIRRITFRVIPDHSTRLRQLLSGDADFVGHLRAADLPRLETTPRAAYVSSWSRQYSHIVWNGCRPPFSDVAVRRAMTLAIDRLAIVEALFEDRARVGITPIPQSVWAFNRELEPTPFDPAQAAQLLARAGWHDSDDDGILDKNGVPFRFELSTNAENEVRRDAALIIQRQLARVGIDARLATYEFNALIERNMAKDFDATIGAWGIDTTLDLRYAFHSASIDDGYNYGCFSNRDVDRLIDLFARRIDPVRSLPLLHEIQRLIHQDQPYTFLWEPQRFDGVGRRLQGVEPSPHSALSRLEEWTLVDSPPSRNRGG